MKECIVLILCRSLILLLLSECLAWSQAEQKHQPIIDMHVHYSVERALQLLGFEVKQLHKLPSDDSFRLSVTRLKQEVTADRAAGKVPFCVVANAGTPNTGAVDPLIETAEVCKQEGLWFHVDGAYGAPAVPCEKGRSLLRGLELADSLTLDPHKWLFQPFEIGCVLIRDVHLLKEAFAVRPEYLKDLESTDEEVNFYNYGIQLSRSFRALKLWMSLKVFGLDAFRKAVARGFASRVCRNPIEGFAPLGDCYRRQHGHSNFPIRPRKGISGRLGSSKPANR